MSQDCQVHSHQGEKGSVMQVHKVYEVMKDLPPVVKEQLH